MNNWRHIGTTDSEHGFSFQGYARIWKIPARAQANTRQPLAASRQPVRPVRADRPDMQFGV